MGKPKAKEITEKQKELYFFLVLYIEDHGFQPSIEEVADVFEVARKSVQDKLTLMQELGLLAKGPAKHERCTKLRHVQFKVHRDDVLLGRLPEVGDVASSIFEEQIRSVREDGYQLTTIEISGTFDLRRDVVRRHVKELEDKGWISLRRSEDSRLLERCMSLNGIRFESVFVPEY